MSSEVAADLLARARDDVAAARALLNIEEITDAIVGFHAQQAVEKSLKSMLAVRGEAFPFTHDLEGLIERCAEMGIDLPEEIIDHAGLLTPYAERHREQALELAELAVASAQRALTG